MHLRRIGPLIAVVFILQSPALVRAEPGVDSLWQRAARRQDQLNSRRQFYTLELAVRTFADRAMEDRYESRRMTLQTVVVTWSRDRREKMRIVDQEIYSNLGEWNEATASILYLHPDPFPLFNDPASSRIALTGTALVGPLSPAAGDHYAFELAGFDSTTSSAVIHFAPKEPAAHRMEGQLTIRLEDGALLEWQAAISPDVHYYPYGRRLTMNETFDPVTGLVARVEWEFEVQFPMSPPFRYVSIGEVTRQAVDEQADADAMNSMEGVHSGTKRISLAERFMPQMSDYERSAMEKLLPFQTIASKPRFWGFTALPEPRYNRVEGAFAGGAVGFKNIAIEGVIRDLSVEGRYGYGFEDRRTKYKLEASKGYFGSRLRFGAKYYRELKEKEQDQLFGIEGNSLTALLYRYDKFHYFYVRGYEAYSRFQARRNVAFEVRYTDRRDFSARRNTTYALVTSIMKFDPNYPILNGRLRRLSCDVEYQIGHGRGIRPRNSYVHLDVHVAHSNNDWLKSDFDFTKVFSSARFHVPTTRRGSFDGALYVGYAKGTLPQQYLFDLYGVVPYALRTVSLFETLENHVQGSRMAAFVVEHNFGGQLLEMTRLPWLGNGKIDLVPLAGVGFADVSRRTREGLAAPTRTLKKPFVEAGFGIGDVFQYLRFEFVWRLNQRNLGKTAFVATITTLFQNF